MASSALFIRAHRQRLPVLCPLFRTVLQVHQVRPVLLATHRTAPLLPR